MSFPAFSPARCQINLGAIRRNFHRIGSPESLMPVIKSDAYGHGLLEVAATLDGAGARRFAVGLAEEGKFLRERGFRQEIVALMGCLSPEDWQIARAYRLTPLVGSFADLDMAAAVADSPQGICIKCDTGMSRLGFGLGEAGELLERLRRAANLRPDMLLSHYACADMPEKVEYTGWQTRVFYEFYGALKAEFPEVLPSLGNSAASLRPRAMDREIYRPGFVLYGGNPFYGTEREEWGSDLEQAMSLGAPVAATRPLAPGQSVSYGCLFTARKAMRAAIIACGYSQGYPRSLSNKADVMIGGRRARQLGRVCMGMCIADISDAPDTRPGDTAWLTGGADAGGVTLQELADIAGTIPYELMCDFGAMNPRVYIDE